MRRRRIIAGLMLIAVFAGAVWLIGRKPISNFVASRFGERMLRSADGKFTDPGRFVSGRLDDAALLAIGACVIVLAHIVVVSAFSPKLPTRWRWIGSCASGFLCLNLFAALACHTALFWAALFNGKGLTNNYTQYQIKSRLMSELDVPAQAVLIGNSQTKAEIDPAVLNKQLGKRLWTTELHFPGNSPYEMRMAYAGLPNVNIKYAICYFTEFYIDLGIDTSGLAYFQTWRGLPDYYRFDGGRFPLTQNICYGLLGDILPFFRLRDPVACRVLGFHMVEFDQARYDGTLDTNLMARAVGMTNLFHLGPDTAFQKKSFLALADALRARGCLLVVCVGQMNPILERELDPSFRADMTAFLRRMARDDQNVILIDEGELPKQTPADYEDLSHVNKAAQVHFSEYIAGILDRLMSDNSQARSALQTSNTPR